MTSTWIPSHMVRAWNERKVLTLNCIHMQAFKTICHHVAETADHAHSVQLEKALPTTSGSKKFNQFFIEILFQMSHSTRRIFSEPFYSCCLQGVRDCQTLKFEKIVSMKNESFGPAEQHGETILSFSAWGVEVSLVPWDSLTATEKVYLWSALQIFNG